MVALAAIFIVFTLLVGDRFVGITNLQSILKNSVVTGVVALGMTFVIISAGIDLSVGSIVACVSVVIAFMLDGGRNPVMAVAFGMLAGALAGLFNSALITGLRLTPFIVTLGTLLILRGTAKGIAQESTIYPETDVFGWIDGFMDVPTDDRAWMLLPTGAWIFIALTVCAAVVLKYTRFGRHVIAVGSNEQAARLCGVPVARVKIAVYTIVGVCAGLAGLAQVSLLLGGDPTTAVGLELQVIAAVVIGGASLAGGTGSIGGTVLGVLIMETLRAGATQVGWPNWVQQIVTGAIIVIAVALDQVRHGRSK
ncbi:MAG: ABC transporter permease [Armatimonadetes bacterium]|nr:ABC transporter permease [Armatimonadota bacterium]